MCPVRAGLDRATHLEITQDKNPLSCREEDSARSDILCAGATSLIWRPLMALAKERARKGKERTGRRVDRRTYVCLCMRLEINNASQLCVCVCVQGLSY